MNRFSGGRDLSVGFKPEGVQGGKDLTKRLAQDSVPGQAAMRFKSGIYFQIAVIARLAILIIDGFDQRKAHDHFTKEEAIAPFTLVQRFLGLLAFGPSQQRPEQSQIVERLLPLPRRL